MKNKFTKSIALYFLLVASISPAYSQDFAWAKHNSGVSIFEEGRAIGLDAMGNVYTAGVFGDSADLDPGAGTFMVYSMGSEDMYVQKLDASGNFVWAFSMGSQTPDQMMDIHVSSSGDVYVTGQMTGTVDLLPERALLTCQQQVAMTYSLQSTAAPAASSSPNAWVALPAMAGVALR